MDAISWDCFDMQMLSPRLQAEGELKAASARQALQLQEMGRRERLLRAGLGRAKEQVGREAGMGASRGLGHRQQKSGFSQQESHLCLSAGKGLQSPEHQTLARGLT